jgi:hypothetical protein
VRDCQYIFEVIGSRGPQFILAYCALVRARRSLLRCTALKFNNDEYYRSTRSGIFNLKKLNCSVPTGVFNLRVDVCVLQLKIFSIRDVGWVSACMRFAAKPQTVQCTFFIIHTYDDNVPYKCIFIARSYQKCCVKMLLK